MACMWHVLYYYAPKIHDNVITHEKNNTLSLVYIMIVWSSWLTIIHALWKWPLNPYNKKTLGVCSSVFLSIRLLRKVNRSALTPQHKWLYLWPLSITVTTEAKIRHFISINMLPLLYRLCKWDLHKDEWFQRIRSTN